MSILAWIVLIPIALALLLVLAGQLGFLSGSTPGLGVRDGRLKPPSNTPNSVSSQAQLYPDHSQKDYAMIEPFRFNGDGAQAMKRLADQLAARPGCQVIQQTGNYVYATCQTRLLKFTDDLEFLLDAPADLIQVRSSSRLGRKDLGVNRARIESIRARFLVAQASGATAAA